MVQNDMNLLLEIIDKRIRKVLKEEHICYRYIGTVQSVNGESATYAPNAMVPVSILGLDSVQTSFRNRSATTLTVGDMVYIDAIGNNLNSGVITSVFKFKTDLFIIQE